MPEPVQAEFPFANDFRYAIRVSKAALCAGIPEEAILGLVDEGKLDAIVISIDPDGERKHRRILANSLGAWMARPWRFEIPVKPTLRPDEFADLFDVSVRHARRLAAAKRAPAAIRRYGERGVIRFLRAGIPAFVQARKQNQENQ